MSRSISVGSFVAATIVQSLMQAAAAASPPVLPTPCLGGACGRNSAATPFVTSGVASAVVSGNNLTVNQQSNSAILNWQNFNIGSGNTVTFNQPSSTAAALNRIWSADPSVIAGALKANGQIYLLNQNGIVFANGAQVNVGSLTASTLDISDQTFLKGLLSNNTATYTSGGILPPVFQEAAGADPSKGTVNVEQGATIQTADGGRVMLIGTAVNNAGKISTPDGQAILASGTTVYLASTTDPSLRGLLIAVDSGEVAANSTTTNSGTITAERGNVTLAGMVVNQAGRVTATTSVNANGSIYLVAGDADPNAGTSFYSNSATGFNAGQLMPNVGGTVTLAPGSVTEVQPDTSSTTTITNAQTFYPSQVSVVGKNVTLQGNSQIVAPGGEVNVTAFANPFQGTTSAASNTLPLDSDGGRVYLDSESDIDVSGLQNVSAPASQNLVQIQLGANELQDDPLLRTGFLHGVTVTVDLSKGTPLLNQTTLDSYANTVGHSIQEVLTKGGSINLTSGGDVITRSGSVQNVSGGTIAFQNSSGATSKLLGANGKVYDISSAPNDIQYIGFADSYTYTDPRWGTTTSYSATGTIAGYLQGSSAGTINVLAPNLYLAGKMLATTTAGPYQRTAATLPTGGTFNLGDSVPSLQTSLGGNVNYDAPSLNLISSVTDTLGVFDPISGTLTTSDAADVGVGDLAANGFNHLSFASNGTVTLPSATHLEMAGNGSLSITAAAIAIDGSIHSSGSAISLKTDRNIAGLDPALVTSVTLASGSVIDVSGNWVNDSPQVTTALGTSPTLWNGGSVSIQSAADSDVILSAGSLVDVSGGGWVNSANQLTAGSGGSISVKSGGPYQSPAFAIGGVSLLGTLRGAALTSGGSLSITSAWVTVAGDPTGAAGELVLSPDFFTQGGFGSYNITGINGLTIGSSKAGAQELIQPVQQNFQFNGSMLQQKSAANLEGFTSLVTLAQEYRKPTNVSFASTLSSHSLSGAGDLTLNRGVTILTDPGATVSLAARENLTVAGTISAPAGTINLSVSPSVTAGASNDDDGYVADQQLLISSTAQLLAPGFAAIYTDNPLGLRKGEVLDGGTINIEANKGSVVARTGSIIDVSGTSGTVDIAQQNRSIVPTTVAGSAGSINIEAFSDIVLNSTLRGNAAPVSGAAGGSLFVGLDKFNLFNAVNYNGSSPSGTLYLTGDRNLIITSQTHLSDSLPFDPSGTISDGVAKISASTINSGGFDNVRLGSVDIVTFDGSPALTTRSTLTVSALEIAATPGARASLNSAYVSFGNSVYELPGSGEAARVYSPVLGDGTLTVNAGTIDLVGNSTLSGFQSAAFNSTGDIRLTYATGDSDITDFTGSLKSSADLVFKAAQIYPTTNAAFTINPADAGSDPTQSSSYSYSPGKVTIFPVDGASTDTPLSALGTLTINSPAINQYGVLTAPFGQIALNGVGSNSVVALHAGSITSVSGGSALIPYGSTQNGLEWTYQLDNNASPTQSVLSQMPSKQVSLNGSDVVLDPNSKVDVSGGGDLYAYEFIAGTGGSKDVLSAGGGYQYAILPSLGSAYAPIDQQYSIGTSIGVGKQVYLSGIPGLAAGYYTLLPARYALLPGAFAVSLVQQNSDILQNAAVAQPGGSYLVAGQFAQLGTSILDSRTSTFLVASSAVVRTQSEYTDSYANAFFYNAAATAGTNAVNLPADAGQLALSAGQQLHLQGTIGFSPAEFVAGKDAKGNDITVTGVGGTASIVASQIEVVEPGAAQDGSLQLTAESLNDLGASVLILGATRVAGSEGDTLNVGATSVTLANGSADPLTAPEIILAGTQTVSLSSGSAISATGTSNDKTTIFNVAGDGALLRASSGAQATVVRTGLSDPAVGTLQIASGTTITATSLALDAGSNTQLDSGSNITAQNVEASSGRISFGDVPTGTAGLNVTSALLSNFKGLTNLSLRSASTIDFYGSVALGTTGSDGSPTLQTVTLDSAALGGYGAGDKTITAGNIVLLNSGSAQSSPAFLQTPDGTGQLTLSSLGTSTSATQVSLGAGSKTIAGFGGVTFAASGGDIKGQGTGSLTLTNAGNLTLSSARVSTDSAAQQSIVNSTGSVTLASAGSASALATAGLGGQLSISGTGAAGSNAIVVSNLIALPSGTVTLNALGGGDLTVTGTGQINVAGVVKPYYDTYAATGGGSVNLSSDQGNVAIQSGAVVDVSGVTSADGKVSSDAGSLSILAPTGQFVLAGTLNGSAAAGQKGGDFALDTAGDHGSFSLSTLGLSTNGFTGNISIRDRNDSTVVVDGTTHARSFSLTADAGAISVSGTVDTSGATNNGGGDISMWAGHDLTLAGGSTLTAAAGKASNGTTQRGGDITLGSTAGVITLASGSTINLSGSAGTDNPGVNPDGQLRLQAAYNSATGTLGVNPIAATLTTTNPATVVVDAGWTYNNVTSLGSSGDLTLDQIATDIQAFSAQESTLATNLTPTGAAFSVQVRPWITVSSTGDLTVSSVVDLHSIAANSNNGGAIDLTLRAAGNLLVNSSITDGFVGATPSARLTAWNLVSGDSANLQLTAGADLASANPLATNAGTGNFVLAPGTMVRTGNGNIDIAAGHEVCIGCNSDGTVASGSTAQQAVIYTAGQPSINAPDTFTAPVATSANVTPEFATDGGNITMTSGGDILSAPTTNVVGNWLWRQGDVKSDGTVTRDTAWWVESNAFQQGVGALGGGNITVQAAGNVTDLSVVIPTTGRVGVAAGTTTLSAATTVINGGGNLSVRAGGNVQGGLFEADLGYGSISAGGQIGASASTGFAPVLVLADSSIALNAGGTAMIDGVLNSTFIPEFSSNTAGISSAGLGAARRSYFYTYSTDSELSISSAGGDVDLNNNLAGVLAAAANAAQLDGTTRQTIALNDPYPASLNVSALSGDVVVGSALTLFPSSTGNLTVLANNNLILNGTLSMSEVDSSQIGSLLAPLTTLAGTTALSGALPNTPLHASDSNPIRLIAQTGDIVEDLQAGVNTLTKQADIVAGGNITNLNLAGKNLNPSDVTLIQAGGNIEYDTTRDSTTNQLTSNSTGIQVAGPGYVEVVAGGGIDLGDSDGVVTTGRLNDARLSATGATLVVAAGLGNNADGSLRLPSYDAFINKYIAATSVTSYAADLLSYDQSLFPTRTDLTASNALSVFESLSRPQQLPFISQVLTDELSATGLAHTTQGTTYQRGFDAINTLFPTKDAQGNALTYKGDINMYFSQLKTSLGGDIDLLAPGGSVVVGVPNPPQALNDVKGSPLAKPPVSAESNLGLLVLAQGAIQGFANGDFDVNQSRVLTLQGGDIILWASTGSIDAGKGAKTAQGAPPPVIQTDANGNVFVNPIGAVSGSGIGQLLTVQGVKAGLVNLIAPAGVVNAGEAGIRVAGDINIAATAVLNVGNIKVGGTATGLPVSDAGALSGALSGANSLGDAGKTVADQLTSSLTAGNNLQQLTESLTPTFITVRMFCLGVQCDAQ